MTIVKMMMMMMMMMKHMYCDSSCVCNQDQAVSPDQADNADLPVLLGRPVKLAPSDRRGHRVSLDHLDLREHRYLALLDQLAAQELPARLDSEDNQDLLDHKVREAHKDSQDLVDLLDSRDLRASLDSWDLADKLATLDRQEVEVHIASS